MFGPRRKSLVVDPWLAVSVGLTARRLGVFIGRDEIDAVFGQGREPKSFNDLEAFFGERKVDVSTLRLQVTDLADSRFVFPCAVPLAGGGAVVALGVEDTDDGPIIRVVDPLDAEGQERHMTVDELAGLWAGSVIVVKRRRGREARDRPFTVSWFWPELWRSRYLLVAAFGLSLVLNGLAFAPIIFIQIALDKVVGYKATTTLYVLSAGVVMALGFNAVLGYIREYLFNFVGDRIEARIAGDVFDKLLGLPMQAVQMSDAATFERSVQGVWSLRTVLVTRVFRGVFDLSAVFVLLPILFAYSFSMGLIALFFAAVMGALSIGFKTYERTRAKTVTEIDRERLGVLRETLNGLGMVKSLGLEEAQRRGWRQLSAALIRARGKRDSVTTTQGQVNTLLQQLMTVTIIFTGIHLVFAGQLSAGSLIAVNMVATRMVGPVVNGLSMFAERDQLGSLIGQVGAIWNAEPERYGRGTRTSLIGRYTFKDLGVAFAGTVTALDQLSFEIPARSRVAIVGPSGSGKSTLVNLLDGAFPPTHGALDVDGLRITQLNLLHYRAQVMKTASQPVFFAGSIGENLRRVGSNVGNRERQRVLEITGFAEHLQKLPDGLDTPIDEAATQLPGAQRQKLALARALLADPKVLLLDEAINAYTKSALLDFKDNLDHIAEGRTLVMVSQELALIADFDIIVVLDEGRIAGIGRHGELLASCPLYAAMWADEQAMFSYGNILPAVAQ